MKRILLLGLIFAFSVSAWANSCVATGSGNWRTATYSTCGGTYPQSGDTLTINPGVTITIPSGETDVVGTSPAVNQGASWAILCSADTNTTSVLQVYGTLQLKGPVKQCNANWLIGQNGVGGGILLHDNSGSQTALPPAAFTVGSILATGVATFTVATSAVQQQSICITSSGTALDGKCGGIISNLAGVVTAQFNYYTAIAGPFTGTATFWPHYEWQICAQTGNCANALLVGNGISSNHFVVTNNNTNYPQGNFGGFTPGGSGRTNEYSTAAGRGATATSPISGGGNVAFHYGDMDHIGIPGLQGGSQALSVSLSLSTSQVVLDHVICRPCTSFMTLATSNNISSTLSVKDTSWGFEPVDGLAALLYANNTWTTNYPPNWNITDTAFLGTLALYYANFPMAHVAMIGMPIVSGGTKPVLPFFVGATIQYAVAPVQRDLLTIDNTQGTLNAGGANFMIGSISRWVSSNFRPTAAADCIVLAQASPTSLTYNWTIDGVVAETWAPTNNACGSVRGAWFVPTFADSTSSAVTITLKNFIGIPKIVTNAGQAPYQVVVSEQDTNAGGSTNIKLVTTNLINPGANFGSSTQNGMIFTGANGHQGTGGGIVQRTNICWVTSGSLPCYITPSTMSYTPANATFTSDSNATYGSTNGLSMYGTNAWYTTPPGTGDILANPMFLDSGRNQVTWASQVNGVTYVAYDASGSNRGPQVKWQLYQCNVLSLCYDLDGNNAVWDSHWDWSNNTGGDPTPACYPNCYYDWVTDGFKIYNLGAFKGTGYNGADFGIGKFYNPAILNQ